VGFIAGMMDDAIVVVDRIGADLYETQNVGWLVVSRPLIKQLRQDANQKTAALRSSRRSPGWRP